MSNLFDCPDDIHDRGGKLDFISKLIRHRQHSLLAFLFLDKCGLSTEHTGAELMTSVARLPLSHMDLHFPNTLINLYITSVLVGRD